MRNSLWVGPQCNLRMLFASTWCTLSPPWGRAFELNSCVLLLLAAGVTTAPQCFPQLTRVVGTIGGHQGNRTALVRIPTSIAATTQQNTPVFFFRIDKIWTLIKIFFLTPAFPLLLDWSSVTTCKFRPRKMPQQLPPDCHHMSREPPLIERRVRDQWPGKCYGFIWSVGHQEVG